jgi:hypothetical protein
MKEEEVGRDWFDDIFEEGLERIKTIPAPRVLTQAEYVERFHPAVEQVTCRACNTFKSTILKDKGICIECMLKGKQRKERIEDKI